jgi:hypothetical protein
MMCSRAWILAALSLIVSVVGCGASSDVPSMPDIVRDPTSVFAVDPVGDTFGLAGATQWDVSELTLTHETDGISVRLDFANDVYVPGPGDPNALVGLVELDLDQNVTTGKLGIVDQLRGDGARTGLGVDAGVNLTTLGADSTVVVYDMGGNMTGRAKVEIGGRRIIIHIPSALLANDDGYVDAAVIVGNSKSPTDLAPSSGHLSLPRPTSSP